MWRPSGLALAEQDGARPVPNRTGLGRVYGLVEFNCTGVSVEMRCIAWLL